LKSRIIYLYGKKTARHIQLFKKLQIKRHIKFKWQGITQKKAYNFQNMAKV
jgi:hypothetical protein